MRSVAFFSIFVILEKAFQVFSLKHLNVTKEIYYCIFAVLIIVLSINSNSVLLLLFMPFLFHLIWPWFIVFVCSPFSSGCWGRKYRCALAEPIGRIPGWGRSWRGRTVVRERGTAVHHEAPRPGARRSPGDWCSCWPNVASRSSTAS